MGLGIEAIIRDLVKDMASATLRKGMEVGSAQYKKSLVTFELCFGKYLDRSHERYSKIKTLLYRDRPVDLKKHYVPTDFNLENEKVCGNDVFDSFRKNKKNIVLGTAGSGKSVLLRRIFSDIIENKRGFIPILVELRLLITPDGSKSILSYIYKSLSDLEDGFTENQLEYALKEGKFALFFDGFDEIDFDQKETYEREILEISHKYSNSLIVVSSRPDDCFSSWDEFYIYKALPLNKEQSVDLISRIEYDTTVKNKFIRELNDGLYEQHRDFLSNPLLLTMMLLTYEQLAEIPEKVHIFYEQAFDTLFHKHDALKSLYKRKSYSGLPIDDFKRIFSAFCIVTFSERKMSFSYHEIIDYIKKSLEIEGFDVKPTSIFNDLVKSVCIIQKDGNIYTFSHRSFQEYFSAYYISNSQSIETPRVLDNIAKMHFRDSVISMLFELNREKVETEWVIPGLRSALDDSRELIFKEDWVGFLSLYYDAFSFHEEGVGFRFSENLARGSFTSWIHRLYPEISRELFPRDRPDSEKDRDANDVNIFLQNTSADDPRGEVIFIDMPPNLEWLNETTIPGYCQRKFNFMTQVFTFLSEKYTEKEKSLASMLFK